MVGIPRILRVGLEPPPGSQHAVENRGKMTFHQAIELSEQGGLPTPPSTKRDQTADIYITLLSQLMDSDEEKRILDAAIEEQSSEQKQGQMRETGPIYKLIEEIGQSYSGENVPQEARFKVLRLLLLKKDIPLHVIEQIDGTNTPHEAHRIIINKLEKLGCQARRWK